jgi:hypothetical protein
MQFYYDFNKMMVTNPLEGVTHFFINPRMIDGFKQLRLAEYSGPDNLTLDEGLPILVLPMEALKLNKGIVKMDDNSRNGYIKVDGLTIYFNFHEKSHLIRINTVIGCKPRKFESTTIRAVTQEEMIGRIIKDIDDLLF